jgi:hypothetical protein
VHMASRKFLIVNSATKLVIALLVLCSPVGRTHANTGCCTFGLAVIIRPLGRHYTFKCQIGKKPQSWSSVQKVSSELRGAKENYSTSYKDNQELDLLLFVGQSRDVARVNLVNFDLTSNGNGV